MMWNLTQREKNIVIAGGTFLGLFFLYLIGVAPVFEERKNLQRIAVAKQVDLKEITELSNKYQAIRAKDQGGNIPLKRKGNFSLFSFLDAQIQKNGIKRNVAYMKPITKKIENSDYQLSKVKVKLDKVYLQAIIDFLTDVESSENQITITSLSLTKAGKKKNTLDILFEAQTPMKTQASGKSRRPGKPRNRQ